MFVTYYIDHDEATGIYTIVSGSEGNEHFNESEVEAIGSREIGHLIISY